MSRKFLIAGNWKMNKTIEEALALGEGVAAGAAPYLAVDVAIFPTFVALPALAAMLADSTLKLGAQNAHPAESGAFTGEIALPMLVGLVDMVILGHSERRAIFDESSEFIGDKVRATLDQELTPVLCVGEQLEDRNAGNTDAIVGAQVRDGLRAVTVAEMPGVILAYEPVWAIGTGLTATPGQADETIGAIRSILADLYDRGVADTVRILYGGSVNPGNWDEIARQENVDGALVGGASLKVEDFTELVRISAAL